MGDCPALKAAQIIAILAAAMASGGIISISLFTIPAILMKPSHHRSSSKATDHDALLGSPAPHIARQWLKTYNLGKIVFPSLALTSLLLYAYVAFAVYDEPNGHNLSTLYAAAGVLTAFIAPFTGLFILPINEKILPFTTKSDESFEHGHHHTAAEDKSRKLDELELVAYLEKWSRLNFIRGVFPLLGAGLGAALSFGLIRAVW